MIGILAQGRLGNQMFQFAFGYSSSKKLSTSFFIFNQNSLHYFVLSNSFNSANKKNAFYFILRNIFSKSSFRLSLGALKKPLQALRNWAINKNVYVVENSLIPLKTTSIKVENNIFFKGFFQSEKYFKDSKLEIKKQFEIKKDYRDSFFENKKQLLQKKYIAIHIRRADYLSYGAEELGGFDLTLPVSYYKNCLLKIKDLKNYNVIFVSDEIDFVKKEFGAAENYFYENNNEITDFQILLNADILIIANSTFSWWAAWLNAKEEKIVYAPNYFSGFKINKFFPADIKVDAWNWVDVN